MNASLNNYLLYNGVTEHRFNNSNTKDHLTNILTGGGGSRCADAAMNNNILGWTLQNVNKVTPIHTQLQGGRVSFPSQYFGNGDAGRYSADNLSHSVTSDISTSTARSGLSVKVGGSIITKGEKNALYNQYNKNMDTFMNNLNSLTGGGTITKGAIDRSFKNLKKKNLI
jgi:hypothetical protein